MYFIYFTLFFIGAALGSFLHVVTLRTLSGKSWTSGRSECDSCRKQLRWWELLPILSYLFLGGSCSRCHHSITPSHFLMELGCGVWSVLVYIFFVGSSTLSPLFLLWWAVGLVAACLVLTDLKSYIIPEWTVAALFLFGVLRLLYLLRIMGSYAFWPVVTSILAALLATGFFYILWWSTKGRGMGFGDVKLVFVLGLLFSWQLFVVALYIAFISGAAVGIVIVLSGKLNKKHIIPFGPFLILGSLIALFWGNLIWQKLLTLLM